MATLKTYTPQREALDMLGVPRHIRQGTAWVVTTSMAKAAHLLFSRGITCGRRDIGVAMGDQLDEAKRVGLLEEEGTVLATTMLSRTEDPVVRVELSAGGFPKPTLLGHWGRNKRFEYAEPPRSLVDKLAFLGAPETPKLRCPSCFREGVRITQDGFLFTHSKPGSRRRCDASGMAASLLQG